MEEDCLATMRKSDLPNAGLVGPDLEVDGLAESAPTPGWVLLTCSGVYPTWVHRLGELLSAKTGVAGEIVGIGGRAEANRRWIDGVGLYEKLRGRRSRALEAGGTALASPSNGVGRVSLRVVLSESETANDADDTLWLMADGLPAARIDEAVKAALAQGRGELELQAVWQQRDGQRDTLTWRCALTEYSVVFSIDGAARKLLALVEHCLSKRGVFHHNLPTSGSPAIEFPLEFDVTPLQLALRQTGRRMLARCDWFLRVFRNVDEDALWPASPSIDLVPPSGRYWADPFLARVQDRLWVFFEEFVHAQSKGRISCLALEADGSQSRPLVVLDEPCHLSYPFVFQHDGQWFMLPESGQRRNVVLYRARNFPDDWEPVAELITDERVADATLHHDDKGWWMVAGSSHSAQGPIDDVLHIYNAPDLLGPWKASPLNPVRVDATCARPAGPWFQWRGRWIRPVQDCRGRYGRALTLLAVEGIGEYGLTETAVANLRLSDRDAGGCVHTYSRVGSDLAVDVQRWRSRLGSNKDFARANFLLTPAAGIRI
jgi:hypothetical protein